MTYDRHNAVAQDHKPDKAERTAFLSSMNSCLPAGGMGKVDLSPVTRFSYTLHGRGDVEGAGIKALGTIILLSIILSGL